MWKNDPSGTVAKHWLDLINNDEQDKDDDHWLHASVKWDGCIYLSKAGNVPFSKEYGLSNEKRHKDACDDYIHICDLDDFINKLTELRDQARKHFGENWNKD